MEEVKIPRFDLIGPITAEKIRAIRKRMLTPSPLFDEEDRDPIVYVRLGKEHDTEEDAGITYQKCGGGKRIIRKRLGGS